MKIEALIETVRRLRAPDGCPWDRKQTHQSLRPYLIEEAYELLEILDQIQSPQDLKDPKILSNFREEMGDVLLQVLLHSQMASETGATDIYDVCDALNKKLIHRHPHVFGDEKATTAESALKNWEKTKAKEKTGSVLEGLPKALPTLQRTTRMIEKVSKVGFQWSDLEGPLAKVKEEFEELKTELEKKDKDQNKIEGELGDLLFSICNVAYMSKINPEDALRSTLSRFESRFRFVEEQLALKGSSPEKSTLSEMDELWNQAKQNEKQREK